MTSHYITKEGYILDKKKLTPPTLEKIRKDLTITPHIPFKQHNIKPKPFTIFTETPNYISLPKFYGIKTFGKPKVDRMEKGVAIDIKFIGTPRPFQLPILECTIKQMEVDDGALICAGCGTGKTAMAIFIACHFKVKTLVIVHKTFLLNQWRERIAQFTNATVGIIQQNVIDIEDKDIVVGMLQSIAKDKYDRDIFADFGLVIFDEAHHAPSEYFSKALPIITCHKSLALSATPKRSDKTEHVLFWYMGEISYNAPPNVNNMVTVKAYNYDVVDKNFKEAKMKFGNDINRPQTINRIVAINQRNQFIVDTIMEVMEEAGRKVLLLSDRIDHLNILKTLIDAMNRYSCEYYIGGMKQTKLDCSASADIILGSYGMAAEGLDIPELNTLVLATPRSNVEQSVGRITRKLDHPVQPLIIDIVDMLPCFANQGIKRRNFYKKLQYNIEVYEVENNNIIAQINLNNTVDINYIKSLKINNNMIDFVDD